MSLSTSKAYVVSEPPNSSVREGLMLAELHCLSVLSFLPYYILLLLKFLKPQSLTCCQFCMWERKGRKSREDCNANLSFPVWNNTGHIKTSLNLNSLTEITIDLQIKTKPQTPNLIQKTRRYRESEKERLDMERRQMGNRKKWQTEGQREKRKQEKSVAKEGKKTEPKWRERKRFR